MTDTALTTTEPQRQRPPAMSAGGAVGALVPQTLEEAFRLASAMAASGMTPRDIDTPEKVLVAIMAGAELGMKPFQACQSFAIVNGRPSLWGDGLMALALTNGLDVEEWMEGEGDNRVAYCRVTRPDNGKVVTRDYSVEKAKTAKLWGKVSSSGKPSPWVTSPDRMLQMRARSYAIRDAAADVLRGMPIREEVEDFIESNPGLIDGPKDEPRGTGLLGKLQTAQTLTEVAKEGFGIRDLEAEAGEASPEAEAKPKRSPRKKATDDALNKAGEEMAAEEAATIAAVEAELSSPAAMVQGDGPRLPASEEELDQFDADEEAADRAENLPADAQVEEAATDTAREVISGPAPADTLYFMADKEAFPSGRRVVFLNGNSEKEAIDDTPAVPTYTEHAPKAPPKPAEREPVSDGPPMEWGPQDDFHAELTGAKDGPEVVLALRTLFQSGECGTPDLKRAARVKAWLRVIDLNAGGAKIDPVSDPFLMSSFIEWSEDVEAIEATLPLAREQEWFQAGGEPMQAGVARAVMDRVTALKGG